MWSCFVLVQSVEYAVMVCLDLKDKYPNFEVGLKCIIIVF